MNITTKETPSVDLDDSSTASITIQHEGIDGTATESTEFFVSSDEDAQTVYVDIRKMLFAHIPQTVSLQTTVANFRLTAEETRSLVSLLNHELGLLDN